MKRGLGWICTVLGTVLILAIVAICLPLTVPRLMGYEVYAIVSGSMEPAIPTGSLVYAKAAEASELAAGDVIVFYGGFGSETVITHRVVENDTGKQELTTRGDANAGNDVEPIPYAHVLGKVERSVPALGYFLPAVTTMEGKLSLLGALAAAVLLQAVGRRLRRDDDDG